MGEPRFKKGDIIQSPTTYPCIVIGWVSEPEVYNVCVINPTFSCKFDYSICHWDLREDSGIPKRVGGIRPEFVDLFLDV